MFTNNKLIGKSCKTLYSVSVRTVPGMNYSNFKLRINNKPNLYAAHRSAFKRLLCDRRESCWKCGAQMAEVSPLFCDKCNVIQNPNYGLNYFQVFGIRKEFQIDQKDLAVKFRKMQTLLHPDKFTNRDEDEKKVSEEYSAFINRAYDTLQQPLKRALHMLSLHGEKIDEKTESSDGEFLMKMMDLNEEVEEADDAEKIKKVRSRIKDVLESIEEDITRCFVEGNIKEAKENIIKMKYYSSVNNRINSLMREQGIFD